MADTHEQAQAASQEAEDTTAMDQATDTTDTQQGTNPLAAYEAELAKALAPAEEDAGTQEQSGDDATDADDEFAEEDAGEPAEEEQAEEQPSDEEDGDDAPKSVRHRFKDPMDIAVAALAKATGKTLIEAAQIIAGNQKAQDAPTERQEGHQEPSETAQSVSTRIRELIALKKEKMANVEFEEAADIDAEIEDLRDKRDDLKASETREKSRSEQAKAQQFEQKFTESEDAAIKFYPDAAKHDSKLGRKMKELDDQARELGDPIYTSPDKPFLLAKAAAKELGILMVKPGTQPAAKPKAGANRPIQPAGGNARTTAPANATGQIDQAIASVKDEAAYDKLLASLGA